jgi:inner membrane transporter RhtA
MPSMFRTSGALAPAVVMLLASCLSTQSGSALATGLFATTGPWGAAAARLGFAAVIMLVAVRPRVRSWTRQGWFAVLAYGITLAGMNGSFYAAIDRIPLGTAVAIEFLGPLVLSAVLSRRPADLACVVLALLGVSLFGLESASGAASLDLLGIVFAGLAGTFWAGYVLAGARVGGLIPGYGGLSVALLIGSLSLIPLGGSGAGAAFGDVRVLGLALATALLSSVLPYSLELAALRRMPRHLFGVLLSLEPVVAAVMGLLVLQQDITMTGAAAIGLVVLASVGSTVLARRAARPAAAEPTQEIPVPSQPSHLYPTPSTLTGEIPLPAEYLEDAVPEQGENTWTGGLPVTGTAQP